MQDRLSATGLKAETGAYQEELARIKAASDANRRRVTALTGKGAEDGGSGDIGRVRSELLRVRRENALWILGKIGLIVLGALLLPRFILWLLTRMFGRGDPNNASLGLLMSSLRSDGFCGAATPMIAQTRLFSALRKRQDDACSGQ